MSKMVQVEVVRDKVGMTTWVEKKPNLTRGSFVKLASTGEVFWKVVKVYRTELEMSEVMSNRNWDNNNYEKHDGTAMKDRK